MSCLSIEVEGLMSIVSNSADAMSRVELPSASGYLPGQRCSTLVEPSSGVPDMMMNIDGNDGRRKRNALSLKVEEGKWGTLKWRSVHHSAG
jgi:hypothetical protein